MKQHPTKYAPTEDDRNKMVTVWNSKGEPSEQTYTNARELCRHLGFTLDPVEAAQRREVPVAEVVPVNDGTPAATAKKMAELAGREPVAAPVWEDLTTIAPDILRKAAAYLKVGEIDGRTGAKRIVTAIDAALDQALTASGDTEGPAETNNASTPEEKAAAIAATIARRRRSYELAAKNAGIAWSDTLPLAHVIAAVAALVEDAKE